MKNIDVMMIAASIILSATIQPAMAKETPAEKAIVKGNDAKRSIKRGAHRVEEALCMKSDFSCGVEKVKNRTLEAKDSTVDKTKEIKNKIN